MTLQSPSQQKLKEITSTVVEPVQEQGFGVSNTYLAKDYDRLLDIMADIRSGKKELFQQLVNDSVDIFHGVVPKRPDDGVQYQKHPL